MRILLLVASLALGVTFASAQSVQVRLAAGQLSTATGTPLAQGSLVLLLADLSLGQSGFTTLASGSLATGSILNGRYQVLGRATIDSEFSGIAEVSLDTGSLSLGAGAYSSLATGQSLAAVWFPTLTADSFSLVGGTSYGLFTTTAPQDSSDSWLVPAATEDIDLVFRTMANFGSYGESLGHASLTAIPEPSTYAVLAGLVTLGLAAHRRRQTATGAV